MVASPWIAAVAASGRGVPGGITGAMVGNSATVGGGGAARDWGIVAEPSSSAVGSLPTAATRAQGAQLGPEGRPPLVNHIDQIVVDSRLASPPPVGLETPANLINLAGQVWVQAAEVKAGSVTHRVSVLAPRSEVRRLRAA